MLTRWTNLLLLMAIAKAVALDSSGNSIVECCEKESQEFAEHEMQYADMRYHDPSEPDFGPPLNEELQLRMFEKEKHQRPFECISDRTDGESKILLMTNPEYQTLVSKCKSTQETPRCNASSPYRTIDGTCNSILFPKRGCVLNCGRRLMPARYEGVSGFRRTKYGKPLPEPRYISRKLNIGNATLSEDLSQTFTFFGQFLAHDLTDTGVTFIGDKPIDCCSHPKAAQHPQCAPILLEEDDPFYSQFNIKCFNFVRSAMCDTCTLNPRIQINQETAFIDLSNLYGLTEKDAKNLRTKDGTGKMRVQHEDVGDLMPKDCNLGPYCGSQEKRKKYCFKSGDRRVNMHTALMSFHTLFLREHNRISKILHALNTHWDEERLYQESRKINAAQMQIITFKEYLPLLLGPELMARYNLSIGDQERTNYDPSTDPTSYAEFTTAAFRLHPIINGIINEYAVKEERHLRNFFDASPLYLGKMPCIMQGISMTPAQKYGRFPPDDVTEYLYKTFNGSYGFDIISVNIQRGRDHGIPSYTEIVKFLSKNVIDIQDFDQLNVFMDPENIEVLKGIYNDVEDMDLLVGMVNERVQKQMRVGPTAGEINAMQFRNLKFGDSFYTEHEGVFTPEQLQSLRKSSLSRILCDNTKIFGIQEKPMLLLSSSNPTWLCNEIPIVDLNVWKE